jgi:uncharacterized protein (TIGR02145 family)
VYILTSFSAILIFFSGCEFGIDPTVRTTWIKSYDQNSATIQCEVVFEGDESVVKRGVVWDTKDYPTLKKCLGRTNDGEGLGEYESHITGLSKQTLYFVRSYAISKIGTDYGSTLTFTTSGIINGEGVTDIDGNTYRTVVIGKQEWMAENLRTTTLTDGTKLFIATNSYDWAYSSYQTPTCCWYEDNQELYGKSYGLIYKFNAVSSTKLCPTGWKVPSLEQWQGFIKDIGQSFGEKLKSVRTEPDNHPRWNYPNEATDEFGLTLTPGGARSLNGTSYSVGFMGVWWTSTGDIMGNAFAYWVSHSSNVLLPIYYPSGEGFSVRCIKDVD